MFLLLFHPLPLNAQTPFYKTIDLGGSDFAYSMVEYPNGNLLVTTAQNNSGTVVLVLLDPEGNEIKRNVLDYPGWLKGYPAPAVKMPDGNMLQFVNVQNDSSYWTHIEAYLVDENLDTTHFGKYDWRKIEGVHRASVDEEGNIIAVGRSQGPVIYMDMFAFKLSPTGEVLWHNIYIRSQWDLGRDILPTRDGGYLVFGERIVQSANRKLFMKVDHAGNFEWEKDHIPYGATFDDHFDNNAYPLTDSTFLLFGSYQWYPLPGPGQVRFWVAVMNDEGEFLEEKYFRINSSACFGVGPILALEDGSFILPGHCETPSNNAGFLKLNADLDSVWSSNLYPFPINQRQELGYASLASDGGILITGRDYGPTFGVDAWFAKVNPCGLLEPWDHCVTKTPEIALPFYEGPCTEFGESIITLFPQPAAHQLSVQLCLKAETRYSLNIYDIAGRKILSETHIHDNDPHEISVSNWAPGLYFVSVVVGNEVVAGQRILIQR